MADTKINPEMAAASARQLLGKSVEECCRRSRSSRERRPRHTPRHGTPPSRPGGVIRTSGPPAHARPVKLHAGPAPMHNRHLRSRTDRRPRVNVRQLARYNFYRIGLVLLQTRFEASLDGVITVAGQRVDVRRRLLVIQNNVDEFHDEHGR